MANTQNTVSKSSLQLKLEESAKRRGLDLASQAGMRQAIAATLPPHKRPVTYSPFAALASR